MKLIDYITGNRKGREARRIEREAMDDPFLHDALEGYDAVPGDPTDAIRRMQRRVTGAAGKLRRRIYWSAAAALLLCAGAGGYLLTLRNIPMQEPGDCTAAGYARTLRSGRFRRTRRRDARKIPPGGKNRRRNAVGLSGRDARSRRPGAPCETRGRIRRKRKIPAGRNRRRHSAAGSFRRKPFAGRGRPAGRCRHRRRTQRPPGENAILRSGLPGIRFRKNLPENRRPASVRGRITDRNGTPLIGATVASGPGKGTVTDSDGNFSLSKIPGTDTLEINYLGYRTEKIPADTSRPIRLALQEDDEQLTECIVVGYGTQKPEARQEDVRKSIPVGGHKAYLRYLDEHKVYPDDGNLPHGKVTLRFRIDSAGRPVDIEVIRSLGAAADREAVRLVREGPDWTPGKGFVRLDIRF